MNKLSIAPLPESAPKDGRGRPPLSPAVIEARKRRQSQEELALLSNPVDQAVYVFQSGYRLSTLVATVLAGFVPVASYALIHLEVETRPLMWILVAGGLVFSAVHVYHWMRKMFRYWLQALGFTVVLEGNLVFCKIAWLSIAGLVILVLLNGITAAVLLQRPREEE